MCYINTYIETRSQIICSLQGVQSGQLTILMSSISAIDRRKKLILTYVGPSSSTVTGKIKYQSENYNNITKTLL